MTCVCVGETLLPRHFRLGLAVVRGWFSRVDRHTGSKCIAIQHPKAMVEDVGGMSHVSVEGSTDSAREDSQQAGVCSGKTVFQRWGTVKAAGRRVVICSQERHFLPFYIDLRPETTYQKPYFAQSHFRRRKHLRTGPFSDARTPEWLATRVR